MPTENERYSYIEYTCDGTTTTFQIPFDYLEQDDITVFVDGVETNYTFTTANTVQVTPAPANGTTVRLRRNTDADTRAVDFRDGSVLTEADLDNSAIQIFNVAQEAMDLASDAVGVSEDGRIDGQNRQIKSVADPTAADHAVNLNFIQAEYGNVTAVKNNEVRINIVAEDIANVNTNATNIADVNTVAGSIANVNTVAGFTPTLNTNMSDINTVATNIADVSNLSGQIDNINTVAASFATGETAPATPNVGDRWFQPSSNTLYLWDGTNWYEAAVYSVARQYIFTSISSSRANLSGNDSNGNLLYIPLTALTSVIVDGLHMVEGADYTVDSTALITFTTAIPAGSTIEVRCWNPMLTAEYTEFQTMQADTEAARDTALTHRNNAETFKNQAETARNTASSEAAAAATSEANALAYRDQANTYRGNASTSASAAAGSASAAAQSSADAAGYAAAAALQALTTAGGPSAPDLPFIGDTDTGIYHRTANEFNIAAGGSERLRVGTTEVYSPANIRTAGQFIGDGSGLTNLNGRITNVFREYDTTTRNFGTGWGTGRTFSNFTKDAGTWLGLYVHVPARNDNTSWGGHYHQVEISYNGGSTWTNLGNGGYDGGVMFTSAGSIHYTNVFTILTDSTTVNATQVRIRFRHRSYNSTVTINGSHDISTGSHGLYWSSCVMFPIKAT